jgi:hypothetical protein
VALRLGNVLVLACVLAVLTLALGATVFFLAHPSSKAGQNPIAVLAISVVVALLIWSIGEGLRYILAGPGGCPSSFNPKREAQGYMLKEMRQCGNSTTQEKW